MKQSCSSQERTDKEWEESDTSLYVKKDLLRELTADARSATCHIQLVHPDTLTAIKPKAIQRLQRNPYRALQLQFTEQCAVTQSFDDLRERSKCLRRHSKDCS